MTTSETLPDGMPDGIRADGLPPVPEAGSLVLALDSAGGACSAAIGRAPGEILAAESQFMQHGHAVALVPMIESVLAQARIAMSAIGSVAVGIGPGGFTGLRIALATARGLGLGLGIPVIGISSFQAAARVALPGHAPAGDCLVLLDSRRAEPYAAWLGPDLAFRAPPVLADAGALAALIARTAPVAILGDGLAAARDLLTGAFPENDTASRMDASRMIEAAADARAVFHLAGDPAGRYRAPARPFYLRPPDVSLPQGAGQP